MLGPRFIVFVGLASFLTGAKAESTLRVLSIGLTNQCATLTWASETGAVYAVLRTDSLAPRPTWQVVAVNVPSAGATTTWRDCEGGSFFGGASAPGLMADTPLGSAPVEATALLSADAEAQAQACVERLVQQTRDAFELASRSRSSLRTRLPATRLDGQVYSSSSASQGGPGSTARFYRVVRTASGIVDGWGATYTAPPQVLSNVMAVCVGPYETGAHSLALRLDGTLVAWGNNRYGQTNVPAGLSNVLAASAGARHTVVARRDGRVLAWGDNTLGQTNVPAGLSNVVDVKAGLWHSLALKRNGTVSAWGDLFNRSNAVPDGLTNAAAIAAGPRHCLALLSNGVVRGWGFDYDFLGNYLPTNDVAGLTNAACIAAGMLHNQALLTDGTVQAWGRPGNEGLALPPGLSNVLAMSAGWHGGLALRRDGALVSWGQAMVPEGVDSVVALSQGATHALVLRTNLTSIVIRSGSRSRYAAVGSTLVLQVVATSSQALTYQWYKDGVLIAGATNASLTLTNLHSSDEGGYYALVSTSSGSRWGPTNVVGTIHPPQILAQSPATNALVVEGWGVRLSVAVNGNATRTLEGHWSKDGVALAGPTLMATCVWVRAESLAAAGAYSVVLSNIAGMATGAAWRVEVVRPGGVHGWGDNSSGQLGGQSNIASRTDFIAVAAGGSHSLGAREDGTVLAWGSGQYGQTNVPPGVTNVVAVAAGLSHSLALRANATVVAWGRNESGQTNVPGGLTNVVAVAAGNAHSLALRADGTVAAWGAGPSPPANATNITAIAAGGSHSLAINRASLVLAWGSNGCGQTTVPYGLSNVVMVAAGAQHSLALKADGTVTGWGCNTYGEATPPGGLSNVFRIAAGDGFSLALQNNGALVAWGKNNSGQANAPASFATLRTVSAGRQHAMVLADSPALNYPVNVAQDLLLIYNSASSASGFVKDYYLAHRPLVSAARVLALNVPPGLTVNDELEALTGEQPYTNSVETPVVAWYQQNPTVRPRYIVCFVDVPTCACLGGSCYAAQSVGSLLRNRICALGTWKPLVTYIAMGGCTSLGETNRVIDCTNYINKLEYVGTNCCRGKVVISALSGSYPSGRCLLDSQETNRPIPSGEQQISGWYTNLLQDGVPPEYLDFRSQTTDGSLHATNVAGFVTHGAYGWWQGWALNGRVGFYGNSAWHVTMTTESFNGSRHGGASQSDYTEWFSRVAFGSLWYENTPVGAMCNTGEPGGMNVGNGATYLRNWLAGRYFSVCAWEANETPVQLVVGDPLVVR